VADVVVAGDGSVSRRVLLFSRVALLLNGGANCIMVELVNLDCCVCPCC
jgi:siroheme synthase (precorrin-2 oxidase/ferrochelatase)